MTAGDTWIGAGHAIRRNFNQVRTDRHRLAILTAPRVVIAAERSEVLKDNGSEGIRPAYIYIYLTVTLCCEKCIEDT